ncbi:MAG: twin transmembrane helix small protein [Gammaproteobacteria bacterium]|nr:twin transmembrane helix small protein [Gammaproteobacteria bacterium]
MLAKLFVIFVMLVIFGALTSGLIFLVRDKGDSKRIVKALTWRIALSVSLFLFLLLAFKLHWITPHAV